MSKEKATEVAYSGLLGNKAFPAPD